MTKPGRGLTLGRETSKLSASPIISAAALPRGLAAAEHAFAFVASSPRTLAR